MHSLSGVVSVCCIVALCLFDLSMGYCFEKEHRYNTNYQMRSVNSGSNVIEMAPPSPTLFSPCISGFGKTCTRCTESYLHFLVQFLIMTLDYVQIVVIMMWNGIILNFCGGADAVQIIQ